MNSPSYLSWLLYDLNYKGGKSIQNSNSISNKINIDNDPNFISISCPLYDLLSEGEPVRFSSSGILPSPLQEDKTYYVYLLKKL